MKEIYIIIKKHSRKKKYRKNPMKKTNKITQYQKCKIQNKKQTNKQQSIIKTIKQHNIMFQS